MSGSITPHASVYADWQSESDIFVLRVRASNPREAWSSGLIWWSVSIGLASAGVALLAGGGVASAVLTALLIAILCATAVGYMRLSARARVMTFALGERSLSIEDDVASDRIDLEDIRRVLIVHDGASARIVVDSTRGRFRCSVGQLYRHSTLECFVAEVPEPAQHWLEAAGLTLTTMRIRGVLRSEWRAGVLGVIP